jgi:hypothetical protein
MKALHKMAEEKPQQFGCLGLAVGALIIIPAVGSFLVGVFTNSTLWWQVGSAGIIVWGGFEYWVSRTFMPPWMPEGARKFGRFYPFVLIAIGVVLLGASFFRG